MQDCWGVVARVGSYGSAAARNRVSGVSTEVGCYRPEGFNRLAMLVAPKVYTVSLGGS